MHIHRSICFSPQQTFPTVNLDELVLSAENKLAVMEPKYEGIPLNTLRRMGKAVRLGVGAALPLLKDLPDLNGIIIGTANGGMEDCIKFLNQVIEYDEGTLTPTNFVQSTSNAIAAQIGLSSQNKNYNITHVHRGLAFENAMLDVQMQLMEKPSQTFLLGGVDEISTYNYNIENLGGWYKKEITSNKHLFDNESDGSIAGEGVAMFIVNNQKQNSNAEIKALKMLHTASVNEVTKQLNLFLQSNLSSSGQINLLLSGENGDNRLSSYYKSVEQILPDTPVGRFKQLCGEYPTASSFAMWLASYILENKRVPEKILKTGSVMNPETILIYNNYKGLQHSFILLTK